MQRSHPFQEEIIRQIKGWTGLRTAVIALGLVAWTATGAKADPMLTYSTAGQIDPSQGVSGTGVISFNPVLNTQQTSQQVDLSAPQSNVSLGTFVVTALPAGQTTTYNNTPFSITFAPQTLGGQAVTSGQIILSGTLNGQVSGSNSTVTADFNQASGYPASNPSSPFTISNGTTSQTLSFNFPLTSSTSGVPITTELLASPSTNNGQTTAQLELMNGSGNGPGAVAAPEPSAIALFLTTVGGLGLRRYIRARRRPV